MLRPHEEARAEFEIICLEDFIPEPSRKAQPAAALTLSRAIAKHIVFFKTVDVCRYITCKPMNERESFILSVVIVYKNNSVTFIEDRKSVV